jgi:hypothetical protein
MRAARQLEMTRAYMGNNPIAAGLRENAEDGRLESAVPGVR